MRGLIAVFLALYLVQSAWAARPWDEYRTIMWIDQVPEEPDRADLFFERLREMGCNATSCYPGMDPEPFARNGMAIYVENVTRPLFIKGDRGWDAAWNAYSETRDPVHFIRKPCLNDPAVREAAHRDIADTVGRYRAYAPFAYDIRDEPSVTTSANPFDFCFCDICLVLFRQWLEADYGQLAALNAQWGTAFATWEDVRPMTTWEIKERDAAGDYNYAPWADHRAFMDLTFADAVGDFARHIRAADPDALAGLEGTQMPHAFGGFNFPLLLPQLDWIEPYDIGCSREIVRSLAPDIPVIATMFESDENLLARRLWYLLLHGDRGAVVWWSRECVDISQPDIPLTDKGLAFARTFNDLTGEVGRAIVTARRESGPIAIHYSQASIRADWVVESRPDGRTWIRRFSSYEGTHNQAAAAREAFVKLIEDCGLQFDFVSSEQIEAGRLADGDYTTFIMPRSYAIGDREAEQIEAFCRAGGTVIADGVCGLFDERCTVRDEPALGALFALEGHEIVCQGMTAPTAGLLDLAFSVLEPALARAGTEERAHLFDVAVGDGRALYLNLDVTPYRGLRLRPSAVDAGVRELFRSWLPAGTQPQARVTLANTEMDAPTCEVHTFASDDGPVLAVMRNPQFNMSEDLNAYGGNEGLEVDLAIDIRLPQARTVRDMRAGVDLGRTDVVSVTLSPWEPVILRLGD